RDDGARAAVLVALTHAGTARRAAEAGEGAGAVQVPAEERRRQEAPRRDRDRLARVVVGGTDEVVARNRRRHPLGDAGRAATGANPDAAGAVHHAVAATVDLERPEAGSAPGEAEGHHRMPDDVDARVLAELLADRIRRARRVVAAAAPAGRRGDDRGAGPARERG